MTLKGSKIPLWEKITAIPAIDSSNTDTQRKGKLLGLYIILVWVILAYITIDNIKILIASPTLEYFTYIIQDLITICLFYIFWRMNKAGRVKITAYISLTLSIMVGIYINDPKYLEYAMVIFALPIGISSFIIRPSISCQYALLTITLYIIRSIQAGHVWEYNFTALVALLILAFMTSVAAQQLEDALNKNENLVKNLQKAYKEITDAYNSTLEGWSHALEIRDQETEGHSKRVTELTIHISKILGFNEESILNIRRGVLLHDIGKIGIPDKILRKPGPLTDKEMATMKRHVQIGYDLLSGVDFLKGALVIPYCHHEKWNGTGYPHGLVGNEIPKEARIFAVVDVYDALSNDRPYRKAWPKNKVLEYIQSEAGNHFDPDIVKIFIQEMKKFEDQDTSNV